MDVYAYTASLENERERDVEKGNLLTFTLVSAIIYPPKNQHCRSPIWATYEDRSVSQAFIAYIAARTPTSLFGSSLTTPEGQALEAIIFYRDSLGTEISTN